MPDRIATLSNLAGSMGLPTQWNEQAVYLIKGNRTIRCTNLQELIISLYY